MDNNKLFPEFDKKQKKFYQPMTNSGFSLGLCVSALQKTIRRGMEVEAGYFTIELIESGYINYLLQRLIIIRHEDVADTSICIHALLLYNFVKEFKKEKKRLPDHNTVMLLVLNMCRAVKRREGDDFKIYIEQKRKEGYKPKIEEYMADFHTSEGKMREPNLTKEEKIKLWKNILTKVNKEKPGNKYKDLWSEW